MFAIFKPRILLILLAGSGLIGLGLLDIHERQGTHGRKEREPDGAAALQAPENATRMASGVELRVPFALLSHPGPPHKLSRGALYARWMSLGRKWEKLDSATREARFDALLRNLDATALVDLLIRSCAESAGGSENAEGEIDRRLLARLVRLEPETAADLVEALPFGARRDVFLSQLLSEWQRDDFVQALEWARVLPDNSLQEKALFHLSRQWIETRPDEAINHVLTLSTQSTLLLVTFANHWVEIDPQAASTWASSLPVGPRQTQVIASLTAAWAQQSPAEAAHYAATLSPGPAQREAIVSAVSGWTRLSPREAISWVSQFPAGPLKDEAYNQALSSWGQSDPASAAEWLVDQPEGTARDAAMSALSGEMASQYPAAAFEFAETIADERLRAQRLEWVARSWLSRDKAPAVEFLAQSNLPAEVVSRLLLAADREKRVQ